MHQRGIAASRPYLRAIGAHNRKPQIFAAGIFLSPVAEVARSQKFALYDLPLILRSAQGLNSGSPQSTTTEGLRPGQASFHGCLGFGGYSIIAALADRHSRLKHRAFSQAARGNGRRQPSGQRPLAKIYNLPEQSSASAIHGFARVQGENATVGSSRIGGNLERGAAWKAVAGD